MKRILLTFGSILSIALPIAASVSCGNTPKKSNKESNNKSEGQGIDIDLSTPTPLVDGKNKNIGTEEKSKPVEQVHLLNTENISKDTKDQDIEYARAEALDALSGFLELSDGKREDYKSKITLAKTKDEINTLTTQAAKETGIE